MIWLYTVVGIILLCSSIYFFLQVEVLFFYVILGDLPYTSITAITSFLDADLCKVHQHCFTIHVLRH